MAGRKSDASKIQSFLEELWSHAQGMLGQGKVRTEQAVNQAKTKLDLYLLSGKKSDLYREVGELFFLSSKKAKGAPKMQQRILSLVAELQEIELQEASLRRDLKGTKATAPAVSKSGKRRGRPPKNAPKKEETPPA
jgi:chaperonin cofactor prefoldin